MVEIFFHFRKKYFSQAGNALGNFPQNGKHICVVNISYDVNRRAARAKIIIVRRIEKATPD